jgi:hypothetical protein
MNTSEENVPEPNGNSKFGSFRFSSEIENCFKETTKVLEAIINTKLNKFPTPTGVVLINLYKNAKAALLLASDDCVNEVYLIMRVLLDAGVTLGYLLVIDDTERKKYFEQPVPLIFDKKTTPELLLNEAKSKSNIDSFQVHKLKPIRERIDVIANKTKINRDSWLFAVASIFPQSSELLCGDPNAYLFRHLETNRLVSKSRTGEDFSMLFFQIGNFLHQLICLCAEYVELTEYKAMSKQIHDQLLSVAKGSKEIGDWAKGSWNQLDRIEHLCENKILGTLEDLSEVFENCYEIGIITPTLPNKNAKDVFRHASLYFKRALNDFRAVWVLLARGYTAQASACAGSSAC